jgi:D-amino-acid oxidase
MMKILVIGAGVSGLTTAFCLAKSGYRVKVIARNFSPGLTSNVAGALWEWPPAVCGYHTDEISLERSKKWCETSYARFRDLSKNSYCGVFLRDVIFFFRENVLDSSVAAEKMSELKGKVDKFRHDRALIEEEAIGAAAGVVDAYSHMAPMVDTDRYMPWLLNQVLAMGVEIESVGIDHALSQEQDRLLRQHSSDFIVNCSGLGARLLAEEEMYPLRGALIRIKNDGKRFPILRKAYCVSYDERTRKQDIVFIVPRGNGMVVLGALAEANEWSTAINLENYAPVQNMFRRCVEFLPILEGAELDAKEPVRVGLRPFRKGNVRLCFDEKLKVIHNYGHGGAGVTLSWGCAEEVVSMLDHAA